MATSNITSKEFGRRFRKALSVPFLLNQVCSSSVKDFVTSYAASLGCSEKCFFFPFLTCAASCMGTEAYIELSPSWLEPPIVWTLLITPVSLHRVNVIEHLKVLLLEVQNEIFAVEKTEDSKHIPKFMLDIFTFEQLLEILKLSNGHGLGLYDSVRFLHKLMALPHETEIMLRLHSGSSWFSDSRVTKSTLSKTRVNFGISSTPSSVHQTLTTAPNFQELFHQCFLTACAEENHVKFAQLSSTSSLTPQLKSILKALVTLHSSGTSIVYKLSTEAAEKFEQIHDELTDKAKQMVRKNAHKVFHPALSYLGRLSCVLHVLDNIIESVTWNLPLDPLTFNTEISAATVWQARELLGHIIEQRHALMEQTTIEPNAAAQQKNARSSNPPAIDLVDVQPTNVVQSQRPFRTPITSQRMSSNFSSPNVIQRTQTQGTYQRSFYNNNMRRNINRPRVTANKSFDSLLSNNVNGVDPRIVSVHSAGLPVANSEPAFNPIITGCGSVNSNSPSSALPQDLNLPMSLSVSVTGQVSESNNPPPLLSRIPTSDIILQGTQASSLAITDEEFVSSFKASIRRLLMHGTPDISPSRCVQLRLTPDPISDGSGDASKQQYTASFARSFLKKLEILGFGTCEGPTNNNMRHFLFKKTGFNALGEKQKRILLDIRITEKEYNKCFSSAILPTENGSIVCLE